MVLRRPPVRRSSPSQPTPRVNRALLQYELALREWYLGEEWLALNDLWIATENLTKAVIRKMVAARGISEEDLAHEYGLVTDDPDQPRWKDLLGARVRAKIIFAGDTETYKAAKDASDGLEHGIWELGKVAAHALKSADKTFRYVRRTIVDLLGVSQEVADELNEIKPKDVQSMRKVVRGRLIGAVEDPAMEGELYPRLESSSGIESVVREGSTFQLKQKERITVRTHPDVGFRLERLEIHGRLENGEAPIRLSDEQLMIEYTAPSPSQRLLGSVMPLVDAVICLGLAISASSADLGSTALAELGTAVLSGAHPIVGGWLISSWLVAHASGLAVDRVSFDGRVWIMDSGTWSQTGLAGGVLSLHHARSAA